MSDKNHDYWLGVYNSRFGRENTRRNVAIGDPVVQNFTIPLQLRQDGKSFPPSVIKHEYGFERSNKNVEDTGGSEYISHARFMGMVYGNINVPGEGKYMPAEHKHLLNQDDLPEYTFPPEPRHHTRDVPLDVRRRL